jgi:RNA polymerase sigma factor (sigma-70 family)
MADSASGSPFYQKLSAYPLMSAERRQELLEKFYDAQLALIDELVAYLVPLYRYFAAELERRNVEQEAAEEPEPGNHLRVGRLRTVQLRQVARILMELKEAHTHGRTEGVLSGRAQLKEFLKGLDYTLLATLASAAYSRPVQAFILTPEEAAPHLERITELLKIADEDREALFNGNWRLVMEIARRFQSFGCRMDLDELIQEGNTGLLAAIDKFNPRLKYQLSTMAGSWIQAKIRRSLDNFSETIRTPVYKRQRRKLVQRAETELLTQASSSAKAAHIPEGLMTRTEQLFGRTVDDKIIAVRTGLTLDEVRELRRLYPETVSINAAVDGSDDGEARAREEVIPDKSSEDDTSDRADRIRFFATLSELVSGMSLLYQVVLSALHGLPLRKKAYHSLVEERCAGLERESRNLLRGMEKPLPRAEIRIFH